MKHSFRSISNDSTAFYGTKNSKKFYVRKMLVIRKAKGKWEAITWWCPVRLLLSSSAILWPSVQVSSGSDVQCSGYDGMVWDGMVWDVVDGVIRCC